MGDVEIMKALTEANAIIIDARIAYAQSNPVMWGMLKRINDYIEAQQEKCLLAVREVAK